MSAAGLRPRVGCAHQQVGNGKSLGHDGADQVRRRVLEVAGKPRVGPCDGRQVAVRGDQSGSVLRGLSFQRRLPAAFFVAHVAAKLGGRKRLMTGNIECPREQVHQSRPAPCRGPMGMIRRSVERDPHVTRQHEFCGTGAAVDALAFAPGSLHRRSSGASNREEPR